MLDCQQFPPLDSAEFLVQHLIGVYVLVFALVVSFVAESALQRVAKRRILPQVSEGADAVGDASRAPGA